MINREVLKQCLFDLNVAGWRTERAHDCDGTEEVCAQRCPVYMQVPIDPDEIVDAILDLDVPPGYAYTPATDAHPNCMIGRKP